MSATPHRITPRPALGWGLNWKPGPAFGWALAMLFVVLWYHLNQAAMGHWFSVRPAPEAVRQDLIAHLLIGTLLFAIARSLTAFVLAAAALLTALTLGNALKISILGGPLMPDDFLASKNMLLLLDGAAYIGALALVAVPALLLAWMLAWRRPRTWAVLGLTALALALLLMFPEPVSRTLDQRFGNSVWNQHANYTGRGLPLHLLQEGVRSRARRAPAPAVAAVDQALARTVGSLAQPPMLPITYTGEARRNVHLILLESFWDPMLLTASRLSADPIDPDFRALWALAGHAHALAPVFGGYTANSEFEVLCGFPVERDNVFFEGGLRRAAPCLPRHLADLGYRTYASHPNSASFWNRVNAYRRIGFDTYWSVGDFELDDMNRNFLSDASLYRQVLDRLGPRIQAQEPVFNYVLTYFGHLPYPLNAERPPVIATADGHETVAAYANTMYYKSRELMAFLRELRQLDPDALVVLLGDHPPALGPRFGGYRESGLLAESRAAFTDPMFRTLVATPIVVIDGRHGVLDVGDLPLYQLPGLLLQLLGDERPSMMAITAPDAAPARIRPLPGMHFISAGGEVTACQDSAEPVAACADSSAWLDALRILARDIFSGAQHALRRLEEAPPAGGTLTVDATEECPVTTL